MTLLPVETWDVQPTEGSGPYELVGVCAHPFCDVTYGLEDHHLWRRSFFGKGGADVWWVRVPNGAGEDLIVPNRVALCREHHRQITENEARVVYELEWSDFLWADRMPIGEDWETLGSLEPQPGPPVLEDMQRTFLGTEERHDDVVKAHDTKTCTKCKGKGRVPVEEPKPKGDMTPRPKTVMSIRVPKDERENGYEVLRSLIDQARGKLETVFNWSPDGDADYYVMVAVFHDWVTD